MSDNTKSERTTGKIASRPADAGQNLDQVLSKDGRGVGHEGAVRDLPTPKRAFVTEYRTATRRMFRVDEPNSQENYKYIELTVEDAQTLIAELQAKLDVVALSETVKSLDPHNGDGDEHISSHCCGMGPYNN